MLERHGYSMRIKIEHLDKIINKSYILKDVNMELESGKIYGFQGQNGSGKTMLFRAISGLIYATNGSIQIDGKVLGKDIAFADDMGIMLENPAFMEGYSGYDNLKMIASIRGNNIDIANILRQVGLNPDDKRKYRKYSLGMKQKLGLACAFMEDPSLLILDEPFNALDQEGQKRIAEMILEKKKKGCLILLTSHDKEELERLSDEMFLVHEGTFTKKGSVK